MRLLSALNLFFKDIVELSIELLKVLFTKFLEYFIAIFHLFWIKDDVAVKILRVERISNHQILGGMSLWTIFLFVNLMIQTNFDRMLGIIGLFLTIISLAMFLYWIKLALIYVSKKHIINPDREI